VGAVVDDQRDRGRLILCATPIGNLGDATRRLSETLESADLILAEDTRRTAKLLKALGVDRPMRSYFAGNEDRRAAELETLLGEGKTVALVTDAGMPAISDPGVSAVAIARRVGAGVTVVPGPSAVTAALAVSGLPAERFIFDGFLPRRGKERKTRLEALAFEPRTVVLFAAPHHLLEDLTAIAQVAGERPLVVTRELTKAFEEIQWTTPAAAVKAWSERDPIGEFTLVLGGAPLQPANVEEAVALVERELEAGTALSEAVRKVATRTNTPRRALYELALARSRETKPER
jgi:16S rRNA (cytidine1402-2'-O)-methyltransferase